MYDTKSRELRWNATFSDYSAPFCEESYPYSECLREPPAAWGPCSDSATAGSSSCADCWGKQLLRWLQLVEAEQLGIAPGQWQRWGV